MLPPRRGDEWALIGVLAFVGLFLATIFFALALPAWHDVHAAPRRVTGTIAALRSVRQDPVGYNVPTGGSKTTYYADVQQASGDTVATVVGRGLYVRLKMGQAVDFDVLPDSGVVITVRTGPEPNRVLSTDDPLGDRRWWAKSAPWFAVGALAALAGAGAAFRRRSRPL